MTIAAVTPSPLWFMTRGTGATALVLLTLSVALGVAHVQRAQIADLPRFVLDKVHRNAALLAVAFVFVHVATAILDGFAPITIVDALVPLHSAYRPVWLGLGAVAFDLLVATIIASLLRRRLGYRAWRATHWLVYACWPVALVHGLGTGSDAKTHWMLLLSAGCVLVVLGAIAVRVSSGWPKSLGVRLSAIGAAAVFPLGLLLWLPSGPLAPGWALRSGTPAAVLAKAYGTTSSSHSAAAGGSARSTIGASTQFTANVTGSVQQSTTPDGRALVDISLNVNNPQLTSLKIKLSGGAIPGGGVQMTSSQVTLGSGSNPDFYTGEVTGLRGTNIAANITGGGHALAMLATLTIQPGGGSVSGTVSVSPAAQ